MKQIDLKIVCDDEKYLPAYSNETDACMDLKVVVPNIKGRIITPNQSKVNRGGGIGSTGNF